MRRPSPATDHYLTAANAAHREDLGEADMGSVLRVGNLPASATEAELRGKFGRFGTVQSVTVQTNSGVGRRRCFGIVEMATEAEARLAMNRLNMTQYEDVTISVCAVRTND